jgi:hypothetical protein
VGSKLIELEFSLGVGAEETLNFEVSDITSEALKNPLQIEIKCDNRFRKTITHRFEGLTGQLAEQTVFNLKSIDFS